MMVSFCVLQTSTAHPGRRGDHRQFLTTHGTLPRFQSRKDKKTYYWACLRKEQHPDEKPVFLPDDKGKPGQRQGQTEAETAACPDCGAQMRRLQSKKNKKAFYWACSKGRENGCPLRSDDNGKVGEAFS
jgi:DNA topoisomerase III